MPWRARIRREVKFLRGLMRTLKRVKSIAPGSTNLICDDLEAAVDAWRERRAITFEGRTITYGEMDAIANRYAHWAKGQGLRRGQTVAVFLPNRLDYLPIWLGLSKIGVISALINNNLTGPALTHCLDIAGAGHVIVDAETAPVFDLIKNNVLKHAVQWTLAEAHGDQRDLGKALKSCSQLRPDKEGREGIVAKDTALYIYTSGTTGLPKAAKISHMRAQLYMRAFAGATDGKPDDRVYITLPLYHATGGLCGTGAALLTGGSVVLKKRFSASQFWEDIHKEACTMFVYIGELGPLSGEPGGAAVRNRPFLAPGFRQRPSSGGLGDADAAVPHSRRAGVLRLHRRQCLDVQLRRKGRGDRPGAQLSEEAV